jgi:hypothetical protein
MASEDKNSVTISKNNAGFPPYLDFNKLRSEGIAYLGKLSGQLWTDHNVHDPGITILEELCYALLDLGYRTNLPVADILSKNTADTSKENNFFTPAQILSCNPLTITDYRKLLIDIEGVRNAWMVPADDITNICGRNVARERNNPNEPANRLKLAAAGGAGEVCEDFLNGIYHVLIETEKDADKDFQNDDPAQEEADKKAFVKEITDTVRKTLMIHRNLCEDFQDIFILCKLDMGVCASIEIKEGFEAENVYIAVANRLHDFFSNVPKFYTLQQLLDKGKSMDDIFAGRPYSSQSHGFIDTEELDSIALKKEIHTSDIYNAIFEVDGVKKISSLKLMTCGKECDPKFPDKNSKWRFHIPENHVPVFSNTCSGFEFTRNGKVMQIDQSQFNTQLELGWLHTGKVMYPKTSPYLDALIPKGIYHEDLDSYYSIQNDFPAVYGIGEGDLADNVPDKRTAQALQLKGYLFFFDQMLANYLSQLKNIRQLFSFTHPADKKTQHTYFLNTISTVPELNKLLRFGTGDGNSGLGDSGTLLAYPVSKADWQPVNTQMQLAEDILASFDSFTFNSLFGLYESTDLLRNDLVNEGESSIKTYQTSDGCYLYTIESSADDFILLGKKICNTEADAQRLAASVQYAGVFEKNYRSFLTSGNTFTFNVELNLDTYTDYLGILVESDELYSNRRKDFLSHLLSRFAETFTDFVLLNWNPGEENDALQVVENYLTCFPDLSRNRGRAYNYMDESDVERSVSGFEKKVKALAGIPSWARDYLCPFAVEQYDESYIIDFSTTGITAFQVSEKFDLMPDALKAVSSLITAMKDQSNYTIRYIGDKREYQLLLDYGSTTPAVYHTSFTNSNTVEGLAGFLAKSFSQQPAAGTVFENSWTWGARIKDNAGNVIHVSEEEWTTEADANAGALKLAEKLPDTKRWKAQKEHPFHGKLFYDKKLKNDLRFVDLTHFNIDINDIIIGKPGKFTYAVLDKGANTFKLSPLVDFDKLADAEAHCHRILIAASDEKNFNTRQISSAPLFSAEIHLDGRPQAVSAMEYASEEDAAKAVQTIVSVINQHIFTLDLLKTAVGWKFNYLLGYEEKNSFIFSSDDEFPSAKSALEAEQVFYKHVGEVSAKLHKTGVTLSAQKGKAVAAVSYHTTEEEAAKAATVIRTMLDDQHKIVHMQTAQKPEALKAFVKVDGVERFGTYVYRLINKNKVPAVYTESYPDNKTAGDKRKEIASLSKKAINTIPDICLGGDIFTEEYDSSHTKWYRYQLMFYNVQGVPGNQLALFESVKAFETADEAIQGFYDNYQQVLLLASDKTNYGKYISTTPVDIPQSNNTSPGDTVAFIQAASLKILQDSFGAMWNEKLVEIVKAYPIKIIDTNSVEFAEIFCTNYKLPSTSCAAGEKSWKYYFSIPITGGQEWRSTAYYDTADAAMADFRYFNRLLLFTGNYFTDCACTKKVLVDNCVVSQSSSYTYKIFVHEVLAQSINWYENEVDAWGPLGVEKFICAVQTGDAFKNYRRREDCCYSFYATCGNGLLGHPCKYDTEKQRGDALNTLFSQLNDFINKKSYGYSNTTGKLVMNDKEGKAFAQANADLAHQKNPCDWYLQTTENILGRVGVTVYGTDGFLRYSVTGSGVTIQSVEQKGTISKPAQEAWIEEWSSELWYWACYFPVTRTRLKAGNIAGNNANNVQYKYCIEIKLPSFTLCDDDAQPYQPCGCDEPGNTGIFCYIAWRGTCCYYTCEEALRELAVAIKLLQERNNYHSVFDCTCNSYGIALNTMIPSLVSSQSPVPAASDIIAFSPQCYETDHDVCDAADTAMHLVNSQGMHLLEHILLRPFRQADCECRGKILHCDTWDECLFPDFIEKGAGGCSEEDKAICFQPEHDPYSFIATVVLPAWSERFRTEQGRILLENVLYTEAPAHVLLRILWLKPRDFCSFETAFDAWKHSLTGVTSCGDNFDICEFLRLLFSIPYDCLDQCVDCQPCTEPGNAKTPSCPDEEWLLKRKNRQFDSLMDVPFAFLNQVNETFCFSDYCRRAEFNNDLLLRDTEKNKENLVEKPAPTVVTRKEASAHPKPVLRDSVKEETKPVEKTAPIVVAKKETPARPKPVAREDKEAAAEPVKKVPAINAQQKAKTVNTRFKKYKTAVTDIIEHTAGNPLAIKTDRFISSQQADAEKLDTLCSGILENQKANKGIKQLTKTQQLHLLRSAVCFYLDKVSFNGKDESAYKQLSKVTAQLKKRGINMQVVFKYWDADEVATVETDADIDFIRKVITGSKK